MPGQRHKMDQVAPGFEARARELWFQRGYHKRQIYELFEQEYGEGLVSESSFRRWFAEVLTIAERDEHIRKTAEAMVGAASGIEDVKDFTNSLAIQSIARLLYESPEEIDPKVLLDIVAVLDRVKRTDLDLERYREQVKRRAEEVAKELEKQLAAQNVDRATTEEAVKSVFGIAL